MLQLTGNTIRFLHNYLPINVTILLLAYVAQTSPAILQADYGPISPSAELADRPCVQGPVMEE